MATYVISDTDATSDRVLELLEAAGLTSRPAVDLGFLAVLSVAGVARLEERVLRSMKVGNRSLEVHGP